MSNDTTLLFGLAGVRVERVVLLPGGVREVHVQTAAEGASGCPSCDVLSSSMRGNVATAPRDIPYGTGPLAVVWHKRRWRCRETLCGWADLSPRRFPSCRRGRGPRGGCGRRSALADSSKAGRVSKEAASAIFRANSRGAKLIWAWMRQEELWETHSCTWSSTRRSRRR